MLAKYSDSQPDKAMLFCVLDHDVTRRLFTKTIADWTECRRRDPVDLSPAHSASVKSLYQILDILIRIITSMNLAELALVGRL